MQRLQKRKMKHIIIALTLFFICCHSTQSNDCIEIDSMRCHDNKVQICKAYRWKTYEDCNLIGADCIYLKEWENSESLIVMCDYIHEI